MKSPRSPTTKSILKDAAEHGINVRIHYGVNGIIESVETLGRAGEPTDIAHGARDLDRELEEFEARHGQG
jgi:hypothetical protein